MAVRLDQTAFAAALKTKYPAKRILEMGYKNNPLYALMTKDTQFFGDYFIIPTRYGIPQGGSATFATAQANKRASDYARFALTRASDYTLASITGETLKAASNNAYSMMKAVESELNGAIMNCVRSLSIGMYGSGTGARSTITAALPSSADLTLDPIDDVSNFEVGMKVQVLDATDGTTLLGSSAEATISAVNRTTGVITISASTWTAVFGSSASGDMIIRSGDANNVVKGLRGWVPTTAPTSTTFFGVNRAVDTRLGGLRFTASGAPIEEALIDSVHVASREGAMIDKIFMNPRDRGNLVKNLGSKVQYSRVDSDVAGIGFRTVQVEGDKGPIDVISDPNCPKGYAFGLQMDTWVLASLLEAPHLLDYDDNRFLREASADAYEIRVGYYAQVGCYAPGWNFVLTL